MADVTSSAPTPAFQPIKKAWILFLKRICVSCSFFIHAVSMYKLPINTKKRQVDNTLY